MTITIGLWALPALVTVAAMIYMAKDMNDPLVGPLIGAWMSCPAWLIWALWGRG